MNYVLLIRTIALLITTTSTAVAQVTVGEPDSSNYGFNFNGVSSHREGVQFTFMGTDSSLTLTLDGYDVDVVDEVQVVVNNEPLGYLSTTPNNQLSPSTLKIPETVQNPGENTLQFIQKIPGWTWGITSILLSNEAHLSLNTIELSSYGYNFNGVTDHRESARFFFEGQPQSLLLNLDGHDIDALDEINVTVNGQSIGFLAQTANNSTASSTLHIPSDFQIPGKNTLLFEQRVPGWKWGITNILLTLDNTLVLDEILPASFGYNYNGVTANREFAEFNFEGQTANLTLAFDAHDIDTTNELDIQINDLLMLKIRVSTH